MVQACFVVLALALPAAAGPASHFDMGPARRFQPAAGEERYTVCPAGFVIDTRGPEPTFPDGLTLDENEDARQPCIVQFTGPIDRRWFRDLERLGFEPYGYIPHYATLCRLDPVERELVRSLPFVRWVGLHQPTYRIEPGLLDRSGPVDVVIALAPGTEESAVLATATELGAAVGQVARSELTTTVRLVCDAADIAALARVPDVFWIQEHSEFELANDDCQWVVQTGWRSTAPSERRVWAQGVRGQGLVLSTTDTGLNTGHDMFRDPVLSITPPGIWPAHRKVVAFKLYEGADAGETPYHGSHVNGTVAGDDSVCGGTSSYDGMAKDARLYFVDISNSGGTLITGPDLWPLWDTVYFGRGLPDSLRPVRQHSGSWGAYNSSGTYLLQDASTDAFGWAYKDFLNIIAAGNEGGTASTIRNPGIAKSVLTVGATQNGTSSNAIASFSSRGPTQDDRIKPNVMAPGNLLWSAGNTGTNTYNQMSGTSMATPAVNGAIGLMRCYLEQGFYPTGSANSGDELEYISSALLRSMAMVSADPNIGAYTVPDNNIGWGRVDVDSVLFFTGDARKLALVDDTSGVTTGQYKQVQFRVLSSIPLRACLAWTDTAAAPSANPALVNDLDLELLSPTGTSYRGNQYSGGQSVPNPTTRDSINAEECVRVNSPETGVWTIKVYGQNVATAAAQPFAYAITGDVALRALDAAAVSINAPTGVVYRDVTIQPRATVRNAGGTPQSFAVRFRIADGSDDYSDIGTTSLLDPGASEEVVFADWTPATTGTFAVGCSCRLMGDEDNTNDSLLDSVTVHYLDVGVSEIVAPSGTYLLDDSVAPAATWQNYGTLSADFEAWMLISDPTDSVVYRQKVDQAGLAAGDSVTIGSFPVVHLDVMGAWTARCSTAYAGDQFPDNDELENGFNVYQPGICDIAVVAIAAPAGRVDTGAVVHPTATWRNVGSEEPITFAVRACLVDPASATVFTEDSLVTGLGSGEEITIDFGGWDVGPDTGRWAVVCSTFAALDTNPANDVRSGPFVVTTMPDWAFGWHEVAPMPAGTRMVKDGGWLAIDPGSGLIYATRGYKTGEFYEYNPVANAWTVLAHMPWGVEGKLPRKGSRGVVAGDGYLYATKGNNTFGFWRYGIASDTWYQLDDVPPGPRRKKVKGGTDLVYVEKDGVGYVYLLKGYKTEFYRYNTATEDWETLPDAPYGHRQKWDKGSWLVHDGASDGWLYAHEAKYYNRALFQHYMFRYDLRGDTWARDTLAGMPVLGLHGGRIRKKKAKDGSAGAYDNGQIYALKGGNTQQFFKYIVDRDAWIELDTMPTFGSTMRRKHVKYGGDLVHWGQGAFFALKGNKTNECWRYLAPVSFGRRPERSGVMAGRTGQVPTGLTCAPNPLAGGFATVRYGLPKAGPGTVRVLDVTGREVMRHDLAPSRTGALSLDIRYLSAGIYLVRLESGGYTATRKLVVEK